MKPPLQSSVSILVSRAQRRAAAFSMICVSVLLTLAGLYTLREYELRSMDMIARSLAFAGEPALRFNDKQAMMELIDNLAATAQVSEIAISDRAGRSWLSYQRPETGAADRWGRGLARLLLRVPGSAQIGDGTAPLGQIALRSDGRTLLRFVAYSALSLLLCALATGVVVLRYSRRLARLIVAPIDALAGLTRDVRESHAFELRAQSASVLEIDGLGDDFNALLQELQLKQSVIERHHAELRRANDSLRMASRQDPLTRLPNRAHLYEHLAEVIEECRTYRRQAGLVFIDYDRFKEVNDRFGHASGDFLLVELSKRLRASIRGSDFVARLGGDEFIVVLEPLDDARQVIHLTDRIRIALDQPVQLPGARMDSISVTMGVAIFPDHADGAEGLIRAADKAMYRAKSEAPGSVATFVPKRGEVEREPKVPLERTA